MGLAVEAVSPPSWSLLGDDDIGWFINVTFNRLAARDDGIHTG